MVDIVMCTPRVSWKVVAAAASIAVCGFVFAVVVWPFVTTAPSEARRRRWEMDYASILPRGYTDFRAHFQSDDVGVRVFSVRLHRQDSPGHFFESASRALDQFSVLEHSPGRMVLRRSVTYSDPGGFDEFRFEWRGGSRRVYVLFANLDSEMDIHAALVRQFEQIIQSVEVAEIRKPRSAER